MSMVVSIHAGSVKFVKSKPLSRMRKLKLILLSVFLLLSVGSVAAAVRGEKSVGLKAGYCTRNESAVAGAYFQYAFSSHFRLSPNIDYVFRHEGSDAFIFGLTAQFPIGITGSRFDMYPLAGVSYSIWNYQSHGEASDDVSTRVNRFGLDFGMGVEYKFASALKIFAQGKFNLVKDYNSGIFVVGIGYVF